MTEQMDNQDLIRVGEARPANKVLDGHTRREQIENFNQTNNHTPSPVVCVMLQWAKGKSAFSEKSFHVRAPLPTLIDSKFY
jgi:hypothetical protein